MGGEKVIICRCNDVTLEDLLREIERGVDDFELLRKKLRIGFGPCQGRGCLLIAARIFARRTGKNLAEILVNYQVRPPIIPVPIRIYARGVEE